jgi:hypothetical protein
MGCIKLIAFRVPFGLLDSSVSAADSLKFLAEFGNDGPDCQDSASLTMIISMATP